MSGIAGIIHFYGDPVAEGLIEGMTTAMAYRGPDGIHHWRKGSVALGQCMLQTTPESLEEHQPLTNEDESLVLVMDGRVDNWFELRQELLSRNAKLRDRSDAELVLWAYEFWGQECLPHIDGDFAFVIWDARQREAFCARDRLGNKPFNYSWDGRTFAFASELHPILALPWVREEINEGMVAEYLVSEWHSLDETFWMGIFRLMAGHKMVVQGQQPAQKPYWAPDRWAELPYTRDEDFIEHYRELVLESVRVACRSQAPVAVEVSGGLDSSAIFCIAEHLRKSGSLPAPSIEGYTMAFASGSPTEDLPFAREVVRFLGTKIMEIPPAMPPLSWYSKRAERFRDFPGFPNGAISENLNSAASHRGCRAVLCGFGGDEWLYGSPAFYAEELSRLRFSSAQALFKEDVRAYGFRTASLRLLRYGFFLMLPDRVHKGIVSLKKSCMGQGDAKPYWLSKNFQRLVIERRTQSRHLNLGRVRSEGQHNLLYMYYVGFRVAGKEQEDQTHALHQLDLRYPLDNQRIVQFAFSLPERLRSRGNINKYIHRRALNDLMPQMVLDRLTKPSFMNVFRNSLDALGPRLGKCNFSARPDRYSSEGMEKLFQVYESQPGESWIAWVLWSIACCEMVGKPRAIGEPYQIP